MSPASQAGGGLQGVLRVEPTGENLFRATSHQANPSGVIFGGSFLGQALAAASATAKDRAATSLHATFLKAGNPALPVDYSVTSLREGRSFSTRHVVGRQGGQSLFEALVSFQSPEPGFSHSATWREPPPEPSSLRSLEELAVGWTDRLPADQIAPLTRLVGLEARILDPEAFLLERGAPSARFWVRAVCETGSIPDAVATAFLSDFLMPAGSSLPHANSPYETDLMAVSLDHTIWFHEPAVAGEWLWHEIESPWAGAGRGLTFGRVFDRSGRLVASTAQEMLLRRRLPSSPRQPGA